MKREWWDTDYSRKREADRQERIAAFKATGKTCDCDANDVDTPGYMSLRMECLTCGGFKRKEWMPDGIKVPG